MKATIDIPDDLYRQVKAKSALEGQTVREVTVGLFENWVGEASNRSQTATAEPLRTQPSWYGAARRYARGVAQHDLATVRRSIARGRTQTEAPTMPSISGPPARS